MKKLFNYFNCTLCVVMLLAGMSVISCDKDQVGNGEDTEQVGGENNGGSSGDNTGEELPGAVTHTSYGVTLTLSLGDPTEVGVEFYGKVVMADSYSADAFGIMYSTNERIAASSATNLPIVDIFGMNYSVSTSSLQPNTTYYYTPYIKQGSLYRYGEVKSFTTKSLVAPSLNDAAEITEVSATISGSVVLPAGTSSDLEYGFQYGTSESFSSGVTTKKISEVDSENKFTSAISSLVSETNYYYRSYIKMNGSYKYGEDKSFTTKSLVAPTLNDASEITQVSATISGAVVLPAGTSSDLEFGFQYGTSESFSSGVTTKKISEVNSENKFTSAISFLVPETNYYYRSYIRMNGSYKYGAVKSFTTLTVDLSSSGSANCYIVSGIGTYKFKAVKGNGSTSVGSVSTASVLWESFGTSTTLSVGALIENVSYDDGYIGFQTASAFKKGNAVIAAKDASGNILWSWHIWLTDAPQGQVYYNNAGTMMDRNLGATSATPGDVGALGLLYQWGRKDPFLGSSSFWSDVLAKSTITWPSDVSSTSSTGTIAYATKNPTTFISGSSSTSYDWHYSSRDNTLWTTSDKTKSIYDPCPPGWRVPDGGSSGVWSKALGSSSSFSYAYNSSYEGMNFSGKFGSASTIWYPASGYRISGDGSLHHVAHYGLYWSASSSGNYAYELYFRNDGVVGQSDSGGRAGGQSVRCLQVID